MKKICITALCLLLGIAATAQQTKRLSFATAIGTGIDMASPATTPVLWQVVGYYNIADRLSAGVGTGLSFYEKTLIPLFADVKFTLINPRRFTPFLEFAGGYGFAPGRDANGGLLLNPSVGVQYALCGERKVFFAIGYQLQKLERLKKYSSPLLAVEFAEALSHSSISLKIGFLF